MSRIAPASPSRSWRELAPWWLLLPLVCQAAFGWIGFNPTDDGWLQAVARRLIEGEVPHRDFIFLRPALSAYLQVPVVWLGGDWVIWWSRLWGWVELAAIAWLWSGLVGLRGSLRVIGYIAATLISAHTFPIMAWHTLDGILLCTLGVVLAQRGALRTAFFCVGCAALCRQNFALFAPLLLCAVGGPVRFWFVAGFWSALPALVYVAALAAVGGAGDFVQQIMASGGAFAEAALVQPVQQPWLWAGVLIGGLAAWQLRSAARYAPAWLALILLLLAGQLATGPVAIKTGIHVLFGACLVGCVAARQRLLGWSALGLGWTTMISIGYPTPALAAAPLALVLARLAFPDRELTRPLVVPAFAVLALVVAASSWARVRFPYCEAPAWELRWNVGEALPGARGLYTNPRTIANLAELRELALNRDARQVPYVVLTDFSAHWIRSPQKNLLPVEWPQETEIGPPGPVRDRVLRSLDQLPPGTEIWVQKYLLVAYGAALIPIDPTWRFYHVQHVVRSRWQKRSETRFFEVFVRPGSEQPAPPPTP
jgi:hypothetical protein